MQPPFAARGIAFRSLALPALLALGIAAPLPADASLPPSTSLPPSASAGGPLAPPLLQKDKKTRKKVPKGMHRNTRFGFQFRYPKKWSNIAIKTSEEWLGAKYVSETEYSYTERNGGWTSLHAPEILVIVFPREVMEKGGTNVDKGEKDGEKVVTITFSNPYKDYDDFLRRTFKGGGYYLSKDKEDEIDGVQVTKLTYLAEKLTNGGPKTIETWIYHTDDVDYAMQIVGLTKHWKKISAKVKGARSSFKLIERDGPIRHSGSTGDSLTISLLDLEEGTPKERRSVAVASEKTMHEEAIAKLPDEGWTHKSKKRVLILSSADKKWSGRVLNHANNLLDWLDDNYGFLNDGGYMRAPIIRICKDRDETAAYAAGVSSGGYGGYWLLDQELVTYKDDTGWTGYAVDNLNSQLYRYWMSENNRRLQSAMPQWINTGLQELVSKVRMDSRKPSWGIDAWEVERYRTAAREGNVVPPRELFMMTAEEYRSYEGSGGGGFWSRRSQAAMLVNYLASPRMSRGRRSKGLLERYLKNMIAVIAMIEEERKDELDKAREKLKDEDGEKKYRDERRRIFAEQEKVLLERTFNLTFTEWDEHDWKSFTKEFNAAYGVK